MHEQDTSATADLPLPTLTIRGVIGGVLMGLANLVPGISGGTMLLASGVYQGFIGAIAEVTTLRFRTRSLVLLGTIAVSAGVAILLLAGTVRSLVIEQRWIMYSLFIGLTLGGVPLVWRLARPFTPALGVGALVSFALMVVMAFSGGIAASQAGQGNSLLLFASGLAGASAMILPGVSGGYLLLLLGQYEPILGAIDQLKRGLLGSGGPDIDLVVGALAVAIPVGLGVLAGIVGVSNLVKWFLDRYPKATLGALLGLLFGAVVGLWPFQQGEAPGVGEVVGGRTLLASDIEALAPEDWPVVRFRPSAAQVGASLGLIGLGLACTLAIARIGSDEATGGE